MVKAYQASGMFLRWNPHFHCLVLEVGFDERGKAALQGREKKLETTRRA
jgi:hypothetical protein